MNIPKQLKDLWNTIDSKKATYYFNKYKYDNKFAKKIFFKYFPKNMQGPVLDVGCGRGRFSAMLAQLGYKSIGLNPVKNESWLDIKNCGFMVADARNLPFKDSTMGASTLILVLGYIQEPERALKEIHRVLKMNGHLIIHVTNKIDLYDISYEQTNREFTTGDITELLEENGFKIEKLKTERFYPPVGYRYFSLFFPDEIFDLLGKITPKKYRGIITIIALRT